MRAEHRWVANDPHMLGRRHLARSKDGGGVRLDDRHAGATGSRHCWPRLEDWQMHMGMHPAKRPRHARVAPTPACGNLYRMTALLAGQCLRVLGAYVQTDGRHDQEYRGVVRSPGRRSTLGRRSGAPLATLYNICACCRWLFSPVCLGQQASSIGRLPHSEACVRSRRA